MCIYCGTKNYRKIYETHYGLIPKDNDGRSYEIHHLDGDRNNNNPSNLKAVSIQEHYDIHFSQGDYGACLRMSHRMNISPVEKSRLSRIIALNQVKNGVHPFQKRSDGTSYAKDRTHDPNYVNPLSRRSDGTSVTYDRYQSGWRSPLAKREDGSSVSKDRLSNPNYRNPWSKRPDGSSVAQEQRKNPNYKEVFAKRADGSSVTSDLLASGRHPSQVSWLCVCGKTGKGKGNFTRFHSQCK
jgi:hypothetical protein